MYATCVDRLLFCVTLNPVPVPVLHQIDEHVQPCCRACHYSRSFQVSSFGNATLSSNTIASHVMSISHIVCLCYPSGPVALRQNILLV